ncbi:unnamed protein product [Trichogramma brassicae]|uniref:DUF7041 domain-containing protein n=1 Tax=Trichogramma brassicae TaxID=86971 RepID=A0A6H5IAG5_9HYME|nr:unnamed protein product [Trichogramma brassicae]
MAHLGGRSPESLNSNSFPSALRPSRELQRTPPSSGFQLRSGRILWSSSVSCTNSVDNPIMNTSREDDPSSVKRRGDGAAIQDVVAGQFREEFDSFKREVLSLFREFVESQSERNQVVNPANNNSNIPNANVASLSLERNVSIPTVNDTGPSGPLHRNSNIHTEHQHHSSTGVATSAASVRYVSTESRLPQFWRAVPEQWFDVVEHYFSSRGISSDEDKYFAAVSGLGADVLREVSDTIRTLPSLNRYASLKQILLNKFSENEEERLNRFAALSSMGSHTPAEFFNVLLAAGGDTFPRESILKVWKQRLPIDIRVQLGAPAVLANEASLLRRAEEVFTILKSSNRIVVDAVHSGSVADDKTEILLKHIRRLESKLDSQSRSQSHKSQDRKSYANKRNNRKNDRSRSSTSESDDVVICAAHAKYGDNTYTSSSLACLCDHSHSDALAHACGHSYSVVLAYACEHSYSGALAYTYTKYEFNSHEASEQQPCSRQPNSRAAEQPCGRQPNSPAADELNQPAAEQPCSRQPNSPAADSRTANQPNSRQLASRTIPSNSVTATAAAWPEPRVNTNSSDKWMHNFFNRYHLSLRRSTTLFKLEDSEVIKRVLAFKMYVDNISFSDYDLSHMVAMDETAVFMGQSSQVPKADAAAQSRTHSLNHSETRLHTQERQSTREVLTGVVRRQWPLAVVQSADPLARMGCCWHARSAKSRLQNGNVILIHKAKNVGDTSRDFTDPFSIDPRLIYTRSSRANSRHALAALKRIFNLATQSNSDQRARCFLSRDHRVSPRMLALHALARRSNWSRDQLVGPCSAREKETGDSACVDTRTLSRTHTLTHTRVAAAAASDTHCVCVPSQWDCALKRGEACDSVTRLSQHTARSTAQA